MVIAATTIVATASAMRTLSVGEYPAKPDGITIIGQCHRYTAYEIRPSQRSGRSVRTRDGAVSPWPMPAAMTIPVPSVGSSAAMPGNGVVAVNAIPEATISTSPAIAEGAASRGGSARGRAAATASPAPRASSHARVGSEKNAHGWATLVSTSDSTKEPAPTTAIAIATRRST